MSITSKHLPSDIDSLSRKDLVDIYHIHVEEMQIAQARIKELEQVMFDLLSLSSFHMSFPFEAERLEDLKQQHPEVK